MSAKPVLKMGHPLLGKVASPVETFDTPELYQLLADMRDTMKAEKGVGLAAPQIGVGLRVVIFGFESSERYPKEASVPYTVLINPKIEFLTNHLEDGWEGCLSVPGMRGLVPRFTKLKYSGRRADGGDLGSIAEGFHARVVQHECDHLDGFLYPMRIKNMAKFGYNEELELSPLEEGEKD